MNPFVRDSYKKDALYSVISWITLLPLYFIFNDHGIQDIITKVAILGLFAMSLNILVGYLGLIAFGHATFFAAGAYTLGLFLQSDFINN